MGNITLWKVDKYFRDNEMTYDITPHDLKGYLYCCRQWWGIRGLRRCYLSKRIAERVAKRLNKKIDR